MTAIFPTRISLYDFLVEDTQPIDSILADTGNMSILQAQRIRQQGLQAIVSALLRYEQKYGSATFLKKILKRGHVKDLRNYNAFNFKTMSVAMQYGHATLDILFPNHDSQKTVISHLAALADTSYDKVKTILGPLALIAIRELAILADFSHLDANEICHWFELQPQFMALDRTEFKEVTPSDPSMKSAGSSDTSTLGQTCECLNVFINFDTSWHDITGYKTPTSLSTQTDTPSATPHYAKVIGRLADTQALETEIDNPASDKKNNDTLYFDQMPHIALPHMRWLLQLAKIADIYLSRNRLKIAPEPKQPPQRPLLNLGLQHNEEDTPTTTSEVPFEYDDNTPFWKDRAVLLILSVIGVLFLLAVFKYNYKQSSVEQPLSEFSANNAATGDAQPTPDIAIVRVDDEKDAANTDASVNAASMTEQQTADLDSENLSDVPQSAADKLSDDQAITSENANLTITEETIINGVSQDDRNTSVDSTSMSSATSPSASALNSDINTAHSSSTSNTANTNTKDSAELNNQAQTTTSNVSRGAQDDSNVGNDSTSAQVNGSNSNSNSSSQPSQASDNTDSVNNDSADKQSNDNSQLEERTVSNTTTISTDTDELNESNSDHNTEANNETNNVTDSE